MVEGCTLITEIDFFCTNKFQPQVEKLKNLSILTNAKMA